MVLDSDVLPRIRPMRLRLVKEPFDNPDYIFELKQDGFRATAYTVSYTHLTLPTTERV